VLQRRNDIIRVARLTASPSLFLMVLREESGTVLRNDLPGRTLARFGSDTEASSTFNLNEGYDLVVAVPESSDP
jgi:hypothetical protein